MTRVGKVDFRCEDMISRKTFCDTMCISSQCVCLKRYWIYLCLMDIIRQVRDILRRLTIMKYLTLRNVLGRLNIFCFLSFLRFRDIDNLNLFVVLVCVQINSSKFQYKQVYSLVKEKSPCNCCWYNSYYTYNINNTKLIAGKI